MQRRLRIVPNDSNGSRRKWKQFWLNWKPRSGMTLPAPNCWCARSPTARWPTSVAQEDAQGRSPTAGGDNERLEFLGDAVLGLVVPKLSFCFIRSGSEGELTRVRAQLVSRQHMAEVAAAIGLGSHLRLSRGEDRSGLRRKSTVLSNTMEAVMGALFLDGGLEPVRVLCRAAM